MAKRTEKQDFMGGMADTLRAAGKQVESSRPSNARKPQLLIPEEFAAQYESAAAGTYQYIGNDVEQLGSDVEGGKLSRAAWIEIVRDANYISDYASRYSKSVSRQHGQFTPEFVAWLKANEYNPQYNDAMDAAVGRAIFGR